MLDSQKGLRSVHQMFKKFRLKYDSFTLYQRIYYFLRITNNFINHRHNLPIFLLCPGSNFVIKHNASKLSVHQSSRKKQSSENCDSLKYQKMGEVHKKKIASGNDASFSKSS